MEETIAQFATILEVKHFKLLVLIFLCLCGKSFVTLQNRARTVFTLAYITSSDKIMITAEHDDIIYHCGVC
jgi:hypothetical protein